MYCVIFAGLSELIYSMGFCYLCQVYSEQGQTEALVAGGQFLSYEMYDFITLLNPM